MAHLELQCPRKHNLQLLHGRKPAGYDGDPQCDMCFRNRLHETAFYRHCPRCRYDLCENCGHKMRMAATLQDVHVTAWEMEQSVNAQVASMHEEAKQAKAHQTKLESQLGHTTEALVQTQDELRTLRGLVESQQEMIIQLRQQVEARVSTTAVKASVADQVSNPLEAGHDTDAPLGSQADTEDDYSGHCMADDMPSDWVVVLEDE